MVSLWNILCTGGTCFAREWYRDKELYIRLYRMSDVLDEINRQLLEKAHEAVNSLGSDRR
jgi:hypothetical protein